MKTTIFTLAFAVTFVVCGRGIAQTAKLSEARVQELAGKLGSPSYVEREKARQALEAIGYPALETIRSLQKSPDLETTRQIERLVRFYELQLLTKEILAPKLVNLKLKDATVQQAIAELAKASGYPIQFQGDATRFADTKITLEVSGTAFWKALDRLCEEAGLMMRVDVTPSPIINQPFTGRGGIQRIQRFNPPPPNTQPRPIILTNRTNEKSFVSYAGAVKTELRVSRVQGKKELKLQFIVSTEPRLLKAGLAGEPIVERLLDAAGQRLAAVVEAPLAIPGAVQPNDIMIDLPYNPYLPHTNRRIATIRVAEGPQAIKLLKLLAGKLALEVDRDNEVLVRIDDVMNAGGKSASGANGGTLKVHSVKALPNGNVEAQITMEDLAANPFGGNVIFNANGGVIIRGNNVRIQGMIIGPNGVQINGNGGGRDIPDLVDAKGQKYRVAQITNDNFSLVNGTSSRTARIVYQPNPGQAAPRELVVFGTRTHTIDVPFRFADVTLP